MKGRKEGPLDSDIENERMCYPNVKAILSLCSFANVEPFPLLFHERPSDNTIHRTKKRRKKKITNSLLEKQTFLSPHNFTFWTVTIHQYSYTHPLFLSSSSAIDAHGSVRDGEALLDGDARGWTPAIGATPGSRVTARDIT